MGSTLDGPFSHTNEKTPDIVPTSSNWLFGQSVGNRGSIRSVYAQPFRLLAMRNVLHQGRRSRRSVLLIAPRSWQISTNCLALVPVPALRDGDTRRCETGTPSPYKPRRTAQSLALWAVLFCFFGRARVVMARSRRNALKVTHSQAVSGISRSRREG